MPAQINQPWSRKPWRSRKGQLRSCKDASWHLKQACAYDGAARSAAEAFIYVPVVVQTETRCHKASGTRRPVANRSTQPNAQKRESRPFRDAKAGPLLRLAGSRFIP